MSTLPSNQATAGPNFLSSSIPSLESRSHGPTPSFSSFQVPPKEHQTFEGFPFSDQKLPYQCPQLEPPSNPSSLDNHQHQTSSNVILPPSPEDSKNHPFPFSQSQPQLETLYDAVFPQQQQYQFPPTTTFSVPEPDNAYTNSWKGFGDSDNGSEGLGSSSMMWCQSSATAPGKSNVSPFPAALCPLSPVSMRGSFGSASEDHQQRRSSDEEVQLAPYPQSGSVLSNWDFGGPQLNNSNSNNSMAPIINNGPEKDDNIMESQLTGLSTPLQSQSQQFQLPVAPSFRVVAGLNPPQTPQTMIPTIPSSNLNSRPTSAFGVNTDCPTVARSSQATIETTSFIPTNSNYGVVPQSSFEPPLPSITPIYPRSQDHPNSNFQFANMIRPPADSKDRTRLLGAPIESSSYTSKGVGADHEGSVVVAKGGGYHQQVSPHPASRDRQVFNLQMLSKRLHDCPNNSAMRHQRASNPGELGLAGGGQGQILRRDTGFSESSREFDPDEEEEVRSGGQGNDVDYHSTSSRNAGWMNGQSNVQANTFGQGPFSRPPVSDQVEGRSSEQGFGNGVERSTEPQPSINPSNLTRLHHSPSEVRQAHILKAVQQMQGEGSSKPPPSNRIQGTFEELASPQQSNNPSQISPSPSDKHGPLKKKSKIPSSPEILNRPPPNAVRWKPKYSQPGAFKHSQSRQSGPRPTVSGSARGKDSSNSGSNGEENSSRSGGSANSFSASSSNGSFGSSLSLSRSSVSTDESMGMGPITEDVDDLESEAVDDNETSLDHGAPPRVHRQPSSEPDSDVPTDGERSSSLIRKLRLSSKSRDGTATPRPATPEGSTTRSISSKYPRKEKGIDFSISVDESEPQNQPLEQSDQAEAAGTLHLLSISPVTHRRDDDSATQATASVFSDGENATPSPGFQSPSRSSRMPNLDRRVMDNSSKSPSRRTLVCPSTLESTMFVPGRAKRPHDAIENRSFVAETSEVKSEEGEDRNIDNNPRDGRHGSDEPPKKRTRSSYRNGSGAVTAGGVRGVRGEGEGARGRRAGRRKPNVERSEIEEDQDNAISEMAGDYVCKIVTDVGTGRICGVRFRRPYDLARHHHTVHSSDRGHDSVCPDCGRSFSRKDALLRHCRIKGHSIPS